ncbi:MULTISPECIES: type VI secretion system accessory protein TagJ [unclassified Massilia]|uniref:type VI secretion system accessory protein TagJ n=1 Tax=unclassified Massilia TaxID=2609279 RepID=UPI00178681A2|nr:MULTISPECIES: type VI secretion system accessory protein TagJ [unclassified Massilia]MBD8528361.1 virulence protein SciE type [Massilia sp. CFBP 13647]MBD8672017.1 virulence protein SciE type [Massilia sp. CFBP 13721]
MLAQELVREGKLGAALGALQDAVRKDAADVKLRIFLFQLLAVMGQWSRALTQLNVAGELDAATLPMVQTYRAAIQCEALRVDIFAGKRAPLVFGEPQPWLAQLIEALKYDASDPAQAAAMRARAFEDAPASSGNIDGVDFAWLADADARMGPVLEAIVNGRYFWIPLARIARIEFDAPSDLRDTVWSPATFTWTNGASTVGLVPTRYSGTLQGTGVDDSLLLARRTEWVGDEIRGQRMFVSDAGDHPLMNARLVAFDASGDAMGDDPDGPDDAGGDAAVNNG